MVRILLGILKNCDLTSKELANDIKQFFYIDVHPSSVRCIVIEFGYRCKLIWFGFGLVLGHINYRWL